MQYSPARLQQKILHAIRYLLLSLYSHIVIPPVLHFHNLPHLQKKKIVTRLQDIETNAAFLKQEIVIPSVLGSLVVKSQSLAQTNASSISGVSELLWSPRILFPQLEADSDDTMLKGIARKSRAIAASTRYFF